MEDKTLNVFFKYYGIGVFIAAIQILIHGVDVNGIESFLWHLFISFMYVNIIGIWAAMAKLGQDGLYNYIKKNLKNEAFGGSYRAIVWGSNRRIIAG